jgi:hypothetical protein
MRFREDARNLSDVSSEETTPKIPFRGLPHFVPDTVAAFLLVLLNFVLYHKVTSLWWTYDDANILRTNFDYRWTDAFTNAKVWPQQLFTPLMMSAFRGQFLLFGLEPRSWYVLHLALAVFTALIVYTALREFLSVAPALSATALFAAGVPLCSVVTQLSTVHYFLAIALSSLSVIAYVRGARRGSVVAIGMSAVLYLAAMLAKEVAIPLPLLLFALPAGDFRSRAPRVVPHGVATVVYFFWRHAALGTFLGAYGWKIDLSEWPGLILRLPWKIVRALAGSGLVPGIALLALMVFAIALGMRRRGGALLFAGLIVAFAPILPLAKEINRRYAVVPWLAISVAFAAAASQRKPRQAAVLLGVVPLLLIPVNRWEWRDEYATRRRMSDEGRFFFTMPPDGLLRNSANPPAVMGELNWLKTVHLALPSGASWFYDDLFLCSNGAAGKRVWEYEPRQRAVVEITPAIESIRTRHCGAIRWERALSVSFHYRKPALNWDLGPYDDGKYSAVIANGLQAFPIPRRDALNLPGMTGLGLRIRYDSPRGWTTYSPELALDFLGRPDVTWRR